MGNPKRQKSKRKPDTVPLDALDDYWKFNLSSFRTSEQIEDACYKSSLQTAMDVSTPCQIQREIDMLACQLRWTGVLFKRVQYSNSPIVLADELTNLWTFVKRLAERPDPLSIVLWQKVSKSDRVKLTKYIQATSNGDQVEGIVVKALNKIVQGKLFYDKELFKDIRLRAETSELIHENPTGARLLKLNRLLLEDAYKGAIKSNRKAESAVSTLSEHAIYPMECLLRLAEMGNEHAASKAAEVLERFVRLLNSHANTNPETFKAIASNLMTWPVLFSLHPRLNQDSQRFAQELGLGAKIDFEMGPSAKWDPSDPGWKIAMHLYDHIKKMRHSVGGGFPSLFEEARQLSPITESGSVRAWWIVAEKVLLTSYPKPEDNEILRSLTNIKNRFKVKSKILEILENRFASLFRKKVR